MNEKITFAQLVEELSDELIIPKTHAQEFINALIESVLDDVKRDGKATVTNFGSFKVVKVAERTGVNPKSGEPLIIPEHERLSFTPYKALEKAVNREFEHLEARVISETVKPEKAKEPEKPQKTDPAPPPVSAPTPEPTPPVKETKEEFDDPFDLKEPEKDDQKLSINLDFEELEEVEDEESTSEDEESKEKVAPAQRFPGPPKQPSNGVSPAVLLGALAVLMVVIIAVWFFAFRETTPEMAASTPAETPVSNQEADLPDRPESEAQNDSENTDEVESMVIPMVQDEAEFVDNPNETMTLSQPSSEDENITITYQVGSGVWIYEIARQTYGNTRLWPLIFQANYTLDNNPDQILPNINLNIPRLEGTTDQPSEADYDRLAQAARYVADAYEFAGNDSQAAAYRKAATWYETLPSN